jgi:hypothetical protein
VPNQNGAPAIVGAYCVTDLAENPLQGVALRQRRAQGMKGIDAGHGE